MNALDIIDLGHCEYETAYLMQKDLVRLRKDKTIPDTLVLVEHPDVYTYGRKSREAAMVENGLRIERGGEATFHNPGQIVAYPIFFLEEQNRDLHKYLRRLESVLVETLKGFGLHCRGNKEATGVWVDGKRKIASIGVAVKSWTTFHGVALNVRNDLKGFSRIQPCGFEASVMTSMLEELGDRCPTLEDVEGELARAFHREFVAQV